MGGAGSINVLRLGGLKASWGSWMGNPTRCDSPRLSAMAIADVSVQAVVCNVGLASLEPFSEHWALRLVWVQAQHSKSCK
jgi:hypothetical protein